LLLFKLRELRGLENPKIDHPLMDSSLGLLPREATIIQDDLIDRVRTRMEGDEFSEDAIFSAYYRS